LENAWLRESKSYNAEICLLLLNKRWSLAEGKTRAFLRSLSSPRKQVSYMALLREGWHHSVVHALRQKHCSFSDTSVFETTVFLSTKRVEVFYTLLFLLKTEVLREYFKITELPNGASVLQAYTVSCLHHMQNNRVVNQLLYACLQVLAKQRDWWCMK
jgi:hypothetical protein